MSWYKRILISLAIAAALLLLPVVILFKYMVYDIPYQKLQDARFYEAHPMLKKMSAVQGLRYPEADLKRNEILLESLPIGSTRSKALQLFSAEGMTCERSIGTSQRAMLVCWARSTWVKWEIELKFDVNDNISGERVHLLKA